MVKRRCLAVAAVVVICLTTLSPGRVILKQQNQSSPQSDQPLFPIFDDNGKEGFIDARGQIVIAPVFDKVLSFHEGLAAVKKDGKWGYIDRTGKFLIPPQWRIAGDFTDGRAPVVDNEHFYGRAETWETMMSCAFIDRTGRQVIPALSERRASDCPFFKEGLAPVCEPGGCGYLDPTGQWAIKPKFLFSKYSPGVAYFSEGLAVIALREVGIDDKDSGLNDFAYIDKTGKTVFQLNGYSQVFPFRDSLAKVVKVRTRKLGRKTRVTTTVGFIDRNGRIKFKFENTRTVDPENNDDEDFGEDFEEDIDEFYEGRAYVKDPRTKRYGYVDRTGRWVIPPKYVEAKRFSDGLASVCTDEQTECAYIDYQGRVVLKMGLWGGDFHNGLARQYLFTRTISQRPNFRNIEGYMNKAGKYVWVSPGGEYSMRKEWWRDNYVGPPR